MIKGYAKLCCASKNHPTAKNKTVTPQDLSNVPLVLYKNRFFQTEAIKNWFAKSNVSPRILLQTSQYSTLHNIISNNIAVGFLFSNLVDDDSNLATIPMENSLCVDVRLVWKQNVYISSAMNCFINYVTLAGDSLF